MIPSFSAPGEWLLTARNRHWLQLFALGTQHPEIRAALSSHSDTLNTLEGQAQLEALAQRHWQQALGCDALKGAIHQHAKALCFGHSVWFEDIELHLAHPALPLIKYYGALLYWDGQTPKERLWARHLTYCRTLTLALYYYARSPRSALSYNAHSLTVSSPSTKECLCFSYQAKSSCYRFNEWRYLILPMPWER